MSNHTVNNTDQEVSLETAVGREGEGSYAFIDRVEGEGGTTSRDPT